MSLSSLAPVQSREWSFLSGGLEPVLQEPFQFCCDVVGSCTGRTSLSCSWVGMSQKEDKVLEKQRGSGCPRLR